MRNIDMKPAAAHLLNRILFTCCIIISIFLYAHQAVTTYRDAITYGGSDLRVRIVGSRLMAAGYNPYFTKWQPGMGEYLCDPNDTYDRPINGVTVTPIVLWLQQPLAHLPYKAVRIVWWGIQQMLYLFVVGLCLYVYRRAFVAVAGIALFAGILCNHPAWVMHLERGQLYIVYAAWVAVLFAIRHRNGKRATATTGAWLALGILMRPTLILFALPAYFDADTPYKRVVLIGWFYLGLAALLVVSNTWVYWSPYFDAIQLYINHEIHGLHFPKGVTPLRPAVIEGTTNLTRFKNIPRFGYIQSINIYLGDIEIWPGRKVYVIFCVVICNLLLLFTYLKTRFKMSAEQLLMLGMLLYLIVEISQPLRAPYNIVVWLPTALVAVGYSLSGSGNFPGSLAPAKQPLQNRHTT